MLIYIASPYSSSDIRIREARYVAVKHFVHWCLLRDPLIGIPFSSILHNHDLSSTLTLPFDFRFWLRFNEAFMREARAFYLLRLPGWENSKGCEYEVLFAKQMHIPLYFADRENETYRLTLDV